MRDLCDYTGSVEAEYQKTEAGRLNLESYKWVVGGRSNRKTHWTRAPNRKAKVDGTMRALYSNPEHPGELRVRRMLRDQGGTRRAAYVRISCRGAPRKPPPKKKK